MCASLPIFAINTAPTSFGTLAWLYDKNGNRQSETRNAGTMSYAYSPTSDKGSASQ